MLDENSSAMMSSQELAPIRGSTGANSEDLDSLQALNSISQVRFAAPHVSTQNPKQSVLESSGVRHGMSADAAAVSMHSKAELHSCYDRCQAVV